MRGGVDKRPRHQHAEDENEAAVGGRVDHWGSPANAARTCWRASRLAPAGASGIDLDQEKNKNPPRFPGRGFAESCHRDEKFSVLGRPGSDLLFQALRLSTIGAEEFNGRVRYGNGFRLLARTTRSAKDEMQAGFLFSAFHSPLILGGISELMGIGNERRSRSIERLGPVSSTPHGVRRLHTRPINVVVYDGS